MHQAPHNWMSMLVPILIVGLVLALRLRNLKRARRLRLEQLWMLPAFYVLVVAAIFWSHPPHGQTWLYVALAFGIGLPLGWFRGKLMHIRVDPETHALSQQASPAAFLFIVLLLLARMAGRSLILADGGGNPEAVFALTDILLAFALGFLTMQRVEMGLRARTLLTQARGSAGR